MKYINLIRNSNSIYVIRRQTMSMRLPFFNHKKIEDEQYNPITVPNHVAIIMDGNGRWANKRGLPRNEGHKQGMEVVKEIVKVAKNSNVKILTLYAFSTENWKRPQSEVEFLMKLPKDFLHKIGRASCREREETEDGE